MNYFDNAASGLVLYEVAVCRPLHKTFYYKACDTDTLLALGTLVCVPFGRGSSIGVVLGPVSEEQRKKNLSINTSNASFSYKAINSLIETYWSLSPTVIQLCQWVSQYYHAPIGLCFELALVPLKHRKNKSSHKTLKIDRVPAKVLRQHQQQAVDTFQKLLEAPSAKVGVLKGVTGSGKTEVYMELARHVLEQGRSVLILMPEIALTQSLFSRLASVLPVHVHLWHSGISVLEKNATLKALHSDTPQVLLGARSAVWVPIPNLGLIIIDEEHDVTYKQQDHVRYHARDTALMRAKYENVLTILGSATLSMETQFHVQQGKYHMMVLPERISEHGLPEVEICDCHKESLVPGITSILAESTLKAMQHTLAAQEQMMIYYNRRGFAQYLQCVQCRHVVACHQCSVTMTMYKKKSKLLCHYCGFQQDLVSHCPQCKNNSLQALGSGTESLHEDLTRLLPEARILRLDRDHVQTISQLNHVLSAFTNLEADILCGTQMLVKGHDFPNVSLVVVIMADISFQYPDFRAQEKAYAELHQIAGRSGRASKKGRVIVQTYSPQHPVVLGVQGALSESVFWDIELQARQECLYPPFSRLARIRLEHTVKSSVMEQSHGLHALLKGQHPQITLLGPVEAFLERAKNKFRMDLLLKSSSLKELHRALYGAKNFCLYHKIAFMIDVDPVGL